MTHFSLFKGVMNSLEELHKLNKCFLMFCHFFSKLRKTSQCWNKMICLNFHGLFSCLVDTIKSVLCISDLHLCLISLLLKMVNVFRILLCFLIGVGC